MYHNRQLNSPFQRNLWQSVALTPLLLVSLGLAGLAVSAPASAKASNYKTTPQNDTEFYKVHFKARPTDPKASSRDVRLDWRNAAQTLKFDIPASHWVEKIELMVSGRPDDKTGKHLPVFVTFNNSKIIPLNPHGLGFDARLRLNTRNLRERGNQVTFSIPKPSGYECLAAHHGGWDVNLDNSFLVVKARRKKRDYQMSDLKMILGHPNFAPKSVSINVAGPQTLKLEALTAQALALRTPALPDFREAGKTADLEIIIATRADLLTAKFKTHVTDLAILEGKGPRMSLHSGEAAKLIITGDTDADVLKMVQAFGTYELPNVRRNFIGLSELTLQNDFANAKFLLSEDSKNKPFKNLTFSDSWGARAKTVTFDVKDRLASKGSVTLPISRTGDVSPDSVFTVELNGRRIAETTLPNKQTTLTAPFNYDHLKSVGNTLMLKPLLTPVSGGACDYQSKIPGLFLGDTAALTLIETSPTPITELSRFSADGAPFSQDNGQNTTIAFTSDTPSDRSASLKVMAHLAKISGSAWVNADYLDLAQGLQFTGKPDTNTLVIGPKTRSVSPLLAGAPKGITKAFAGRQRGYGLNVKQASLDRYASALPAGSRQFAARQLIGGGEDKLQGGGLIGLYATADGRSGLNGVISVATGDSFSRAAESLVELSHWNALTGSVARWNRSNVLMVQLAKPVSYTNSKIASASSPFPKFPRLNFDETWSGFSTPITHRVSDTFSNLKTNLLVRFDHKAASATTSQSKNSVPALRMSKQSPPPFQMTLSDLYTQQKENTVALRKDAVLRLRKSTPFTALKRQYETRTGQLKDFTSVDLKLPNLDMPDLSKTFAARPRTPNYKLRRVWQDTKQTMALTASEFSLENEFKALQRSVDTRLDGVKRKSSFTLPVQTQKTLQSWKTTANSRPGLTLILAFIAAFILLGLASPASRAKRYK